MGKQRDKTQRVRRTNQQITADSAKKASALKKNTSSIAMHFQKQNQNQNQNQNQKQQQPQKEQQTGIALRTVAQNDTALSRQSPRRRQQQQQPIQTICIDSQERFNRAGASSFDSGMFGLLVSGEEPPATIAQDPTPIRGWRVMIYDREEKEHQWKMAIVKGPAKSRGNSNNVLVDYIGEPYARSSVAASLRLDNFGDGANEHETWFRIDYKEDIEARRRASASKDRAEFARRCNRTKHAERGDGHCLFRAIVWQEQGLLKKPISDEEGAASTSLLDGLRGRVASSLESNSLALARLTTSFERGSVNQGERNMRQMELAQRSALSTAEMGLKRRAGMHRQADSSQVYGQEEYGGGTHSCDMFAYPSAAHALLGYEPSIYVLTEGSTNVSNEGISSDPCAVQAHARRKLGLRKF